MHQGVINVPDWGGPAFADNSVRLDGRRADAALAGLRRLQFADLKDYKSCISAAGQMGFGYYFPYLLCRDAEEDCAVFLGEDEGSVCVFLRRYRTSRPHLDVLLAPAPMNTRVLRRCLERANDHNGDLSATVMKIDEKDVDQLSDLRTLRVKKRKEQYLYSPRSFIDIRGNRFRTLRRNVAMAEALPNLEVLPFTSEHARGCLRLLRRWRRRHRYDNGHAARTAARLIGLGDALPDLDLRGEVIYVDGRLSAFSFGGELRPGLGCFVEAKSNLRIPGLSYFQRLHFLRGLSEFELVNDGPDAGRAGLKQLKDSFRPVKMHIEYRAYQQPGLLRRVLKRGTHYGKEAIVKILSRKAPPAPPNT